MRLLFPYENVLPTPQADAEVVLNTAAALARRPGLEVELLVPRRLGEPLDEEKVRAYYGVVGPLEIRSVTGLTGFLPAQHGMHALRTASDAKRHAPDLVYGRSIGTLLAALAAGHHVAMEHYRPWGDQIPPLQPVLRALMCHPRFVGAVLHSEYSRASYLRLGIPEERLTVVHNGYDPHRLEPRIGRSEARLALGLPANRPLAVYTGRVNEKKGLDVVLEMARRCSEVLFVLVGSSGQGPIEREAAPLPNVRIVPWQSFDRTSHYLFAADVLVIPPSLDPLLRYGSTVLPLKVFTYLAAGRAVLAPASPDTEELLRDGENAALVPPGDPAEAARTLELLVQHASYRERLARGALATSRELTWDARAERIHRFLRRRMTAQRAGVQLSLVRATPEWSAGRCLVGSGRWLASGVRHGRWILPRASEPVTRTWNIPPRRRFRFGAT